MVTAAATEAAGTSRLADVGATKGTLLGADDASDMGVGTPNARSPSSPVTPGTPRTPSEDGEGPRLRQRFAMGAALGLGGAKHAQLCRDHWLPDKDASACMDDSCGVPFTLLNRRHHCRCCGDIFCNRCVSVRLMLDARTAVPTARVEHGVEGRVCFQCYERAIRGQASIVAEMRNLDLVPTHTVATSPITSQTTTTTTTTTGFDPPISRSTPSTPNEPASSPVAEDETAALLAATPTTPEQMRTVGADELRGLVTRYNRALRDQQRLTQEAEGAAEEAERGRRVVEGELALARAQVKRMGALWEELTNARRELEQTRTTSSGRGGSRTGLLAAAECSGDEDAEWSTRLVWHDATSDETSSSEGRSSDAVGDDLGVRDDDGNTRWRGGLVVADPALGTVTRVGHDRISSATSSFDDATGHSVFRVTYRDGSGWERRLTCRVDGVVAANRWARELGQRVLESEARGPAPFESL